MRYEIHRIMTDNNVIEAYADMYEFARAIANEGYALYAGRWVVVDTKTGNGVWAIGVGE